MTFMYAGGPASLDFTVCLIPVGVLKTRFRLISPRTLIGTANNIATAP